MAQILVRGLDDRLVANLKQRAKRNGRSLQAELKKILTAEAKMTNAETLEVAKAWQKKLAGRTFPDVTAMIREDRER